MVTLYYAKLSYGKANLVKLQAEEKEKTYSVKSSVEIVGYFFEARTQKKTSKNIFTNINDALAYLAQEAKEEADTIKDEYEQMLSLSNELNDIVEVSKSEPEKVEQAINELLKK